MDYEKEYKKLKADIKKAYLFTQTNSTKAVLENILPELRESEDERIKKDVKRAISVALDYSYFDKETANNCLAWLEKQVPVDEEKVLIGARTDVALSIMDFLDRNTHGMCLSNMECKDLEDAVVDSDWSKVYYYMKKKLEKQGKKPSNEIEPKFQNWQWIVWKNKCYKVNDNGSGYELIDQNGLRTSLEYGTIDENAHLWNIKDAKKGDVLACNGNIKNSNGIKYEKICLFNNLDNAFFTLTKTSNLVGEIDVNIDYPDNTIPATKEQKEILFMAMTDAGYTFDFEKKELKKIEQESAKWSEEDEHRVKDTIYFLDTAKKHYASTVELDACIDWLKSIKQRIGG